MAQSKAALRRPERFTLELGGETINFMIRTLVRRDAMLVMHTTIRPLLQTIAGIMSQKTSGSMKGNVDAAEVAIGFQKLIDAADFETIETIAKPLFDQAMVDDEEIDFEDYFGDNPLQLYPAVYHALKLNYPDVFRILQPVINRASAMLKDQTNGKQVPEPPTKG